MRKRIRRAGTRRTGDASTRAADIPVLVAVVAEQNRGWVLETIGRAALAAVDGPTAVHFVPEGRSARLPPLPPARAYFFTHYLMFQRYVDDPACRVARTLVWFTHPGFTEREAPAVAELLNRCTVVVSTSSRVETLTAAGLSPGRVEVLIPGVDPVRFAPHQRGHGSVGLCSAYYPRKAPDRIVEIVESLPGREFVLLGPGWADAPIFERLSRFPNFRHLELSYEDYPSFYDAIDVFVSPSQLEGGPVPLLEAMMANVVPVATRTGFAEDLIRHGVNGFVCDVDAPAAVFADLIEQAYTLDGDIRSTVDRYTPEAFALRVAELAAVAEPG